MIGTIVVPLDGSDLAEQALPTAQVIAQRAKAAIQLVRVIPGSAPASARDEAYDYLRGIAAKAGITAESTVWLGDPAEQLIECAAQLSDELIVMTTHGRGGVGRRLFGSVADRVAHSGVAPMLLIRSGNKAPTALGQVMLPLDGSALSETALPLAIELSKAFGAKLYLVRVAETTSLYGMFGADFGQIAVAPDALQQLVDEMVNEAQSYLAGLGEKLKGSGIEIETAVLEGTITEQLLAFGRDKRIDLVAMATRGRTGMSRLVLGSVAEQMLRLGDRPLLLVPPGGEGPAKE